MNTHFNLLNRQLELVRYPAHLQHQSWQAWDSADELLIEYVSENIPDLSDKVIHIYNDDFGTLGCWFAGDKVHWVSDSFVSTKSLRDNLTNNGLSESVNCYTSMQQPSAKPDIVLIKLPKAVALLEQQLIDLQPQIDENTILICAGKAKAIQKSTLALFEKHIGETRTSLAKKKSRLIFSIPQDKTSKSPYPTIWHTDNPRFEISNLANVFARQQLDIGARFLLEHLPDCSGKRVIDLGCGNGVLSLHVLEKFSDCEVVLVDESAMALASARQNIEKNLPGAVERCEFLWSNCLDEFSDLENQGPVDIVLCNPPFHQQNAITDHIAYQMFKDAKHHLNKGGELRIIGNRHLDYPQKLKRMFGGYKVIASDRKFSILSAIKR